MSLYDGGGSLGSASLPIPPPVAGVDLDAIENSTHSSEACKSRSNLQ